ncbi:hypothetical protein [Pendulispora albinea]|uniref:WYL domain-containing protein n=1 Tax=Pendulispora albinea TaxID=2741071 RepID=A0ABZ2LW49_9BACT
MPKEKEATNRRALRITDQFRKDRSMVYDFRCDDDRLTVTITPRERTEDEGDWHVEAWAGGSTRVDAIRAWGETRAQTVRAVADSWSLQRRERQLPPFDWDAVATALATVRAI